MRFVQGQIPLEHHNSLRAGGGTPRIQHTAVRAGDDAVHRQPAQRFISKTADLLCVRIIQRESPGACEVLPLALRAAVKKGCELFPGDGIADAKSSAAVTLCDPAGCCPADRFGAIGVFRHIGEIHGVVYHGAAFQPPQDRDRLTAGPCFVGRERGGGGAGDDGLLIGGLYSLIAPAVRRHIREGEIRIVVRGGGEAGEEASTGCNRKEFCAAAALGITAEMTGA